jgi:hypothetical protein
MNKLKATPGHLTLSKGLKHVPTAAAAPVKL